MCIIIYIMISHLDIFMFIHYFLIYYFYFTQDKIINKATNLNGADVKNNATKYSEVTQRWNILAMNLVGS